MNAAVTKPRAKANPKASYDALKLRMTKIRSALDEGHKKLYLAQQTACATDLGTPAEVLLTFVTENLLPEAIAPLQQTPLTREIVDAVYTSMFPALAALQGVIALARDAVIEATVREAHDLLDAANCAMDFNDVGDVLPHAVAPPPLDIQLTPHELGLQTKHDQPATLTLDQMDQLTAKFDRANATLSMLTVVFGDDSPFEAQDSHDRNLLMGLVQHADNLLAELHLEISEIDGRLPEDTRWRTFEAHGLLGLLERIEFDRGFSFETFPGPFLAKYLESAINCIDRAHKALKAHWENRYA